MGTVEPKLAELVEQLQAEQRRLWLNGKRIAAETYFERHPGLLTDTTCALNLVYNEVLLREGEGEGPRLEEFVDRFPRFAEQLVPLFDVHRALESNELLGAAGGNTTLNMPLSETTPRERSQDGPTIPGHEVLEELGRGGMGVVYKARHIGLNRLVAVKVILDSSHADPLQLARFRAEAEAVARLQHPNIVQIYDVGEQEGRPYFSLEFVDGGNLAEALSGSPQPARLAAGLIRTLARAVEEAHLRGIVHRDLKPSNILLQRGEHRKEIRGLSGNQTILTGEASSSLGADDFLPVGQDALPDGEHGILSRPFCPKITDFGLAKHLGTDIGQTCSGAIMGTPSYMAPEQALGRSRDTGVATDVYALGAILYEMLSGRPPFKGENRLETLRQIVDEEPLSLSRFHIKVSPDLDVICLKCLNKDPARRYPSAEELAEDLDRFLTDQPIHARRTPLLERSWRWCRRNPLAACLVAFTVMAAIGASVAAVWLNVEQQATLAQLHKTIEAEETGQHRLFNSLVAQTRASRLSQRQGRRFKTLEVIAEATQLARRLNLREEEFLTLRSEAASCMALTDLRVDKVWEGWPAKSFSIAFDGLLERYARVDRQEAVTVYRVSDNALLYHLPGRKTGEAFPFLSDDGQYLAVVTLTDLRLWRLTGPEPALVLQTSEYSALAFHPDSHQFAVGTPKGAIRIHELPSGRELLNLSAGKSIVGLAFNPKKPQLATTGGDGAQILELPTGRVAGEFGRGIQMSKPAWHPEGHLLAVVGSDARITIWDIPANRLHRVLEGFKNSLTEITFNHAGDMLASTGWEGFLRLWDPHTGKQLFSTDGTIGIVRFSPDDQRLAGSIDGTQLGIWQVGGRHEYRTLVRDPAVLDKKYPTGIATSPKHGLLAMAVGDGIQVSDLASGADLAFLRMLSGTHQLSFEPSGALLTNSSYGAWRWPVQEVKSSPGTLRVGPPQQLLPDGYLGQIDVSADGRVIAMAMSNAGACVFRKGQSQPLWLDPHKDVRNVVVSPGGELIATASFAGTGVRIWESQSGKLVKELVPDEGTLRVEFSPNGKWLATGSSELCRLWSTVDWQQDKQFGEAAAFAFSPDKKLMALITNGGSIRLVDPQTGVEYVRLEDPSQDRGLVRFSSDATQIVTNNDDPSVHVWDLRTIRVHLAELGLDWNLPAYPQALSEPRKESWRVQVDPGSFGRDAGPCARQALARYTLAAGLQPFNAEAFYQRAVAHGFLEQWPQALEACTKSLLIGQERVEAHYLRGQILQRLGRHWEAFAEFSQAVKLEPNRVPTPEEVQKILSSDLHDAEECNELAWDRVSGSPKDYVPGLAVYLAERLVLLKPNNWYYRNTLGVAYYRLGRWQQALYALDSSLSFSKGRFDAFDLYYLSMVYHRLGRTEQAKQCFERANNWWAKQDRLVSQERQELTSSRAEAAALLGLAIPAGPKAKGIPPATSR